MRWYVVRNYLRFEFLFLRARIALQMCHHFVMLFPDHFRVALEPLEESDVWERKDALTSRLRFGFDRFIDRFALGDQVGGSLA